MKPKRSDQSLAIYGVIAIGLIALVGFIVLAAIGKPAPEALLTAVVVGAMTGVLGWARGGTYYDATAEVVPGPPVTPPPLLEPVVEVAPVQVEAVPPPTLEESLAIETLPTRTPAVYPLPGTVTPDRIGPVMAAAQPAGAATPAEVATRSEVTS